ncbi:DNA/RNA-binding protein Kin17 WH-like domain-containing protein [Entamoeba marina]
MSHRYTSASRKLIIKMKSRGLQKTKWYCQMCQKQCRDENGFKCHCESEGHRRMIELYASNPTKYQGAFSKQFEDGFLAILQHRHHHSKIRANVVYNEYIQDKTHTHLNGTRWTSLSGFIRYLQSKGLIDVEESDEGLMIELVKEENEEDEEGDDVEEPQDEVRNVLEEMMKQARYHGIDERGVEETIVKDKVKVAVSITKPKKEVKEHKKGLFDEDDDEEVGDTSNGNDHNKHESKEMDNRKRKMPKYNPNQPPLKAAFI